MSSTLNQFQSLPQALQQQWLLLASQDADRFAETLYTMEERVQADLALQGNDAYRLQHLRQRVKQRLSLLLSLHKLLPSLPASAQSPPAKPQAVPSAWRCPRELKALKCDSLSLELPLFALSARERHADACWQSRDGARSLDIYRKNPAAERAGVVDRTMLIFLFSHLCQHAAPREKSLPLRLQFTPSDYLGFAGRDGGGRSYHALYDCLDRLSNTRFRYRHGEQKIEAQGLIAHWQRLADEGIEVELAPWMLQAVKKRQMLTLNPAYLQLRQPLARRLYELMRKHCGHKADWRIGLDLLHAKSGSCASRREFRRMLRELAHDNPLPDYLLELDEARDQLHCQNRAPAARLLQGWRGRFTHG